MLIKIIKPTIAFLLLSSSIVCNAQDDLLDELNEDSNQQTQFDKK